LKYRHPALTTAARLYISPLCKAAQPIVQSDKAGFGDRLCGHLRA